MQNTITLVNNMPRHRSNFTAMYRNKLKYKKYVGDCVAWILLSVYFEVYLGCSLFIFADVVCAE